MRRGENQKLKMLYIIKILMAETDESHGLGIQEIVDKLEHCGVKSDRKTLYVDFDELKNYGIDIISDRVGKNVFYRIGSRDFQLAELKLLVDSVQSSKFVTEKKSRELIKKLEGQTSRYEAQQLHREVILSGRAKTMNESIYYNVDKIHTAIGSNYQIRFQYFQWNVEKEMELRHDGNWYHISPWALIWNDENYYLVGYDSLENKMKHYRVDKMLHISVVAKPRLGKEQFEKNKGPAFAKQVFGMFSGEKEKVTMEAKNEFAGIFIDRFGKDIFISKKDKEHFSVSLDIEVSDQFLGWVFALGDGVKITSPQDVVDKMKAKAEATLKRYS